MEKELLSKLNAYDTHDNIMVSILSGTDLEVDISETGSGELPHTQGYVASIFWKSWNW